MIQKVICDLSPYVTPHDTPHDLAPECINPRPYVEPPPSPLQKATVKIPIQMTPDSIRVFSSGASRDTDEGKLDYEGFLSPRVLRRYAEYMQGHTMMADGSRRASDNWQKGIPKEVYMKSLTRHFMELWEKHRTQDVYDQETLCAILFNAMGLLHEELK